MALDIIQTPDGEERKLGCLAPPSFPTGFPCFADSYQSEMMQLDAVRAALASFGGRSMYGRRERFAGARYVRNQRHFGSCNGFSTALLLSRARELRGEPYVCLSGADAYSQMNYGRDQGSVLSEGLDKVLPAGIAPEDMVPWDRIFDHQISGEAKAARARFRGFKAYAVDTEEELATAVALGRMCVVAVHATNAFNSQDGNGVNLGGNGVGNHSVFVQDVRMQADGTLNYDMVNSWDVSWCSGGHTWLTFAKHLRQTIQGHRFWALVSTSDDDKDGSVPPTVTE